MNPLFANAVRTAQEAAGSQHYPQGCLYVVATPIGNLADISLRALHVLGLVDLVACEDTRHTGTLLQAYGLHKPLLALHQHNEAEAAQQVAERLRQGERVAYASDAGTPGVSDPGARLVAALRAQGLRCMPLPGASSVTALLSVAGLVGVAQEMGTSWRFAGFLPSKGQPRQTALRQMLDDAGATLLLEAPHRIEALALELAAQALKQGAPSRLITVGRELTKQFEQIVTLALDALPAWLAEDGEHRRGEFALLLHPSPTAGAADTPGEGLPAEALRVLDLLLTELSVKSASQLASDITGASRKALYQAALQRGGRSSSGSSRA